MHCLQFPPCDCAGILPLGADDSEAQYLVVHTFANGCDLIRNIPAFRTTGLSCPMTAVLRMFERAQSFVRHASPTCLLLPMMALQLVRLAPILWEVSTNSNCPCMSRAHVLHAFFHCARARATHMHQ